MKHWHKDNVDDTSNEVNPLQFRPPYSQASSVDIEMTSYALLTYARQRDVFGGLPIAKRIAAQRNADGGFSSTQVNVSTSHSSTAFVRFMNNLAILYGEKQHVFEPQLVHLTLSARFFSYPCHEQEQAARHYIVIIM
jgi:A-macroglobulin TED domain